MSSDRITVRIPKALETLIRDTSRARETTSLELVRTALWAYLGREASPHSAYELAKEAGLIGCARHAPKDLSTSRRYFEGFGKSN
jgi:hypothetical protein